MRRTHQYAFDRAIALVNDHRYRLAILLTIAAPHLALAGGTLVLTPEHSGPYTPGSVVRIAVDLVLDQPRTDGVRLVKLDFTQTDHAITVLAYDFTRFYEGSLYAIVYSDFADSVGSSITQVHCIYTQFEAVPGFIVVPDGNVVPLGELTIDVGETEGAFLLDVKSPGDSTVDAGARFEFGGGCTDFSLTAGDLAGGQLLIDVHCTYDSDCDDGNDCTADYCDANLGCVNAFLPECAAVPAISEWGLVMMTLVALVAGSMSFRVTHVDRLQ